MKKKKISIKYTIFTAIFLCACIACVSVLVVSFVQDRPNRLETEQTSAKPDASVAADKEDTKLTSEEKELDKLKQELVTRVMDKYPDVELSFYIKNLDSGAEVVHNNKKLNSASVIKLFIMETVYNEMAAGNYTLTPEKKQQLELMITESNNNAANMFIDDFGGVDETRKVKADNAINKTILQSGYADTELNRKMHDVTPPEGPTGYENYTSVKSVAQLLEKIYRGTAVTEEYSAQMLELLKQQKRRAKIPSLITQKYPHITVANKTGELSQVENDVAIIMSDDVNLIFVVMINDIPKMASGETDYALKEEVQRTIGEMGLKVVDFYLNDKYKIKIVS